MVVLFVCRKNTTKFKESQCISNMHCKTSLWPQQKFGLFKYQSGNRKIYLNSPDWILVVCWVICQR